MAGYRANRCRNIGCRYRYYRLQDNKIIEHWALIDGNAIENQLKDAAKGCNIQELIP